MVPGIRLSNVGFLCHYKGQCRDSPEELAGPEIRTKLVWDAFGLMCQDQSTGSGVHTDASYQIYVVSVTNTHIYRSHGLYLLLSFGDLLTSSILNKCP